jgi:hypothetical protein
MQTINGKKDMTIGQVQTTLCDNNSNIRDPKLMKVPLPCVPEPFSASYNARVVSDITTVH